MIKPYSSGKSIAWYTAINWEIRLLSGSAYIVFGYVAGKEGATATRVAFTVLSVVAVYRYVVIKSKET